MLSTCLKLLVSAIGLHFHKMIANDPCLFLQLIDELLPVVAGAPNLGGHNRSGESIKAAKAKQKMQQLQPGGDAALARRAGSFPGNVAQVPNAGVLHGMAAPHEAAWEQAPLLVRVRPCCTGCMHDNAVMLIFVHTFLMSCV